VVSAFLPHTLQPYATAAPWHTSFGPCSSSLVLQARRLRVAGGGGGGPRRRSGGRLRRCVLPRRRARRRLPGGAEGLKNLTEVRSCLPCIQSFSAPPMPKMSRLCRRATRGPKDRESIPPT